MTTALPFQTQQPAFARMGELANFANMSFEQQESYMRSLDTWRTVMAAEEFTFNKGLKEGREVGLAEGRAEGRAEGETSKALAIARKMQSKGFSVEDIAEMTGLSPEEINSLQK